MGVEKNKPTLKIILPNGVTMIKFQSSQEEYELFNKEDQVLTAICKCSINYWNGVYSPQLLIENYEIREEWIF